MFENKIGCQIVSAEQHIFDGEIAMLVATGIEGELGIHPNHAPLLTQLVPGPIRLIFSQEKEETFYVSGGFLEVQAKMILVLADTAIRGKDIDAKIVEEAKNQALQHLQKQDDKNSDFDYSLAKTHLAESLAQLRTIRQLKKLK